MKIQENVHASRACRSHHGATYATAEFEIQDHSVPRPLIFQV
jgi:hypothetical protein